MTKRVLSAVAIAFGLALIGFWAISGYTARRAFDLLHTPELTQSLLAARQAQREATATCGKLMPEQTAKNEELIDRGLLILTELDVYRDELSLYLVLYGSIPFVLAFLAIHLLLFMGIRHAFQPLRAVSEAAGRYTRGDTSAFPVKESGPREIQSLASALNQMMTTIHVQSVSLTSQARFMGWRDVAREVVHESKNLLTPLRLTAEELVERGVLEGDERLNRDGERLLSGLRSLERMNTSLKDLSGRRVPVLGPVAVLPLLQAVAELHRSPQAEIDVMAPEQIKVLADSDLLTEALTNVVVNAIEAHARSIRLSGRLHEEEVTLECADDGEGISPERLGLVTRLSYTTKPGGSGFGLYFTRSLATQFGGRLEVQSEIQGGTTIRIVLPNEHSADR